MAATVMTAMAMTLMFAVGMASAAYRYSPTSESPSVDLPTLGSSASLGAPVHASAGLSDATDPTGTITFEAYGPFGTGLAACTTPVFADTVTVEGGGTYDSANFVPTQPGYYRWTADYSGDDNNGARSSACNAGEATSAAIEAFGPDGIDNSAFEDPLSGVLGSRSIGNVAIDQARQRLYVVNNVARQQTNDAFVSRIHGFDISSEGEHLPLDGFPVGAPGVELFGGSPPITVDNSLGGSGDLYYAPRDLYSYTSSGQPKDGFPPSASVAVGIGVDSSGHLWATNRAAATLNEYSSTGVLLGSVSVAEQGNPTYVAVDQSTDDIFLANESGQIWKYTAASGYASGGLFVTAFSLNDLFYDSSHHLLYLLTGERISSYNDDGALVEVFADRFPAIGGVRPGHRSIAIDESTGTAYVSDGDASRVLVFPGAIVPDPSTGAPTGKASVSGHIEPDGGGDVTGCEFQFGQTTSYGSSAECEPGIPPNYSSAQDVTATLPGLVPETTYHYRLLASNANGSNVGRDRTITPHWVDRLATQDATDIGRFTATLHASFIGNGDDTNYYFEWGKEPGVYESESAIPPGANVVGGAGATPLSFNATGLAPGTAYHYRIVASNGSGTSLGEDENFETLPAVLGISTDPATSLGSTSAALNGSFTGTGQPTSYFFEWGLTKQYGNSTAEQIFGTGANDVSNPVSFVLPGLEPETTYHYRLVATNDSGTSRGKDVEFTTAPAVAGVTTGSVTAMTLDSLTLNGSFVGNGDPARYYFEWGPTTAYGHVTALPPGESAGSPDGPQPTDVSAEITSFKGYSKYHYRLVVTNEIGTTRGADQTVTTLPAEAPTIGSAIASAIAPTAATLTASIDPNRWDTVYRFEYGASTNYGSLTKMEGPIEGNNTSHSVTSSLQGLSPATVYHFRTVAINFSGTSYGADQTFVTPDAPRIESSSASGLGQSAASLEAVVIANASPTQAHFDYGVSSAYGNSTQSLPVGTDLRGRSIGVALSGLASGTTYHFRVVAVNAVATVNGPDQTFTTAPATQAKGATTKCRKGFVKRRGTCVRKRKSRKGKGRGTRHHKVERHG